MSLEIKVAEDTKMGIILCHVYQCFLTITALWFCGTYQNIMQKKIKIFFWIHTFEFQKSP